MFPTISLGSEPWVNVRGLFIPLLNSVAFSVLAGTNIQTFDDAKQALVKCFGKDG